MIELSIPAAAPDDPEKFPDWCEEHAGALADWLEFYALAEARNEAVVENLLDALDLTWDMEDEEIHIRDQFLEDIGGVVMGEVDARRRALGAAYPFAASDDGATLALVPDWTHGGATYLFCLILAHVTRSPILPPPLRPPAEKVPEARNELFESCATVGAASITRGPAFRMGALRRGAEALLTKLREVWALVGDGQVRDKVLPDAPLQVNDGGVDVISWRLPRDGRAGTLYLLGQAASGHDWVSKPISEEGVRLFHRDWFDPAPASRPATHTFVPFRVDGDLERHTIIHGTLIDRLRLPGHVDDAISLAEGGLEPIEGLDALPRVRAWVIEHQEFMRGGGADAA